MRRAAGEQSGSGGIPERGRTAGRRRELLAAERWVGEPLPSGGRLRVAILCPSPYAVAMSSLAVHTLWRLLAGSGWQADRAFLDPQPGRTLQDDLPLSEYHVLAAHVAYEPDYVNLARLLEAGGVPALRAERGPGAPLVIAGGPAVTANPAPLAPLLDLAFLGEVEPVWAELSRALELSGESVTEACEAAQAVPGVYRPGREEPVQRQVLSTVDRWPTASVLVTPRAEFSDMFLVEVGRGCPHGCKFCLTRQVYHPFRPRSAPALRETLRPGLAVTSRVGLVGAAVSDHPQLLPLCEELVAQGAQVSTSSLRADAVTPRLLELLAASGTRSLTLAPETGTEELRRRLGKPLRQEHLLGAVAAAEAAGMQGAKLYFMTGLPEETPADREAIPELVAALRAAAPRLRLEVTVSPLVPKAHTPWAEVELPAPGEMRRRLAELRRELAQQGVAMSSDPPREWVAQTALSRGGEELGPVLVAAARRSGAGALEQAAREAGLHLEDYLHAPRDRPGAAVAGDDCERRGEP